MILLVAATAGGVLLAGWAGYPLLLVLLDRRRLAVARNPASRLAGPRAVSVVVATREAPRIVAERVANLTDTDHPAAELEIVLAVDRTAVDAPEVYRQFLDGVPRVVVVSGDAPGGKAATLNAGVRTSSAECIVFADSHQRFDRETIPALLAAFDQAGVGGVTGELTSSGDEGVLGYFWHYELGLRALESRLGKVVVVTGAVHALHRRFWEPLPGGLLCDDLLIPLRTARRGGRIVTQPRARAHDGRQFDRATQLRRRIRTLTGILQICAWEPWVLVPGRNRLWLGFVCHKLIRIATPFLVLLAAGGALLMLPWQFLGGIGAGGVAAGLALIWRKGWPPSRLLEEIGWALRLLTAPVYATANALRGRWDVWHVQTSPTSAAQAPPRR